MKEKFNLWQTRIENENANYKKWEQLFKCSTLEDYWEGKQWDGVTSRGNEPYVLNMVYSTIKIKLANVIYQRPQYSLTANPSRSDWNQELAVRATNIKEGALNTVIKNPRVHFVRTIKLAALDSFFRFGIIRASYAADWQNPNKTRLYTTAEENPDINLNESRVVEDEEVPENERIFLQHIKARRFRVSTDDSPILDHCNWCGYYTFIRKSVLAKTKGIHLPSDLKDQYYSTDINFSANLGSRNLGTPEDITDYRNQGAFCKVWMIWDNIKKDNVMVLDHAEYPIIWEQPYDRLPFPNVLWDERAPSKENCGFYPMPPVFQWLSSQDEINEARQQLRNYRRRFIRKFWYNNKVKIDEVNKLSNNIDGEAIKLEGLATGEEALGQISNPEIGATIQNALNVSSMDMNLITGTSANAREQADRTTATESKIIDMRSQIRESVEQMDFSQFITDCGREVLLTMQEKFSEGMWIKMLLDPGEQFGDEMADSGPVFEYITNQEINDSTYDWDIDINVLNGTPAQMAEEEAKFLKFLTIVMSNPMISLSPVLLRETATKVGYKNERVIREMQKVAQMQLMAQATTAAGKSGGGTGAAASMSANANPNPTEEIGAQLQEQIV